MPAFDVDAVDLAVLRRRLSAKYQNYDADVIPAWVAEMDFPLAEPIAVALHAAIDRSDTGYRSAVGLAGPCRSSRFGPGPGRLTLRGSWPCLTYWSASLSRC